MAQFTKHEVSSWPEGTKMCSVCRILKSLDNFTKHPGGVLGRHNKCRQCRVPERVLQRQSWTFVDTMYRQARSRAPKIGKVFSLTKEDIVIPEICPILQVPLVHERGHQFAPSLDRINSSLGYTKDNVMVISYRANVLKNNMTPDESILLSRWLVDNSNRVLGG